MKTIYDIELITKIHKNPSQTVGQRSYQLFYCYYEGFNYYRKLDDKLEIEKELNTIPSLVDFIETKFKVSLGTRSWTAPIRYYCEDERELFDEVINHLFEYEKKYPFRSNLKISFSPRPKDERLDFQDLLGNIGYRPAMYFGLSTLESLRAFIDGYFTFKQQYGLELTVFESLVLQFISKYIHKRLGKSNYKTWDRNYRWEWDFVVFGGGLEEFAIPRFLLDLEKYTKTKIQPIENNKKIDINWYQKSSPWATVPYPEETLKKMGY